MTANKQRSVQQIIEDQVNKWELTSKMSCTDSKGNPVFEPVITISRLPGCNAWAITQKLSEKTGFDIFDSKLLEMVSEYSPLTMSIVESLDERGVSSVEEFVKSLIDEHYFSSEKFFRHLAMVVATIAKHGHSIIVGRGANMMIPPPQCLRVSLTGHLERRIDNVAKFYNVPHKDARKRVIQREADRNAYIRRYFHVDMSDPRHYDVTINMDHVGIDAAVDIIVAAWKAKQAMLKPS